MNVEPSNVVTFNDRERVVWNGNESVYRSRFPHIFNLNFVA